MFFFLLLCVCICFLCRSYFLYFAFLPAKLINEMKSNCLFCVCRTFYIGSVITLDYNCNLWNLDEGSDEYRTAFTACNERTWDRILQGCLTNRGMYIKLGQVLVTANYVLPKEILLKLSVLHDKALTREYKEVL